jgi:hypothetical protein
MDPKKRKAKPVTKGLDPTHVLEHVNPLALPPETEAKPNSQNTSQDLGISIF